MIPLYAPNPSHKHFYMKVEHPPPMLMFLSPFFRPYDVSRDGRLQGPGTREGELIGPKDLDES